MTDTDTLWPRRRRARHAETAPARFEEALALCLKALRRGDLECAHAAARLAERLIRLEARARSERSARKALAALRASGVG